MVESNDAMKMNLDDLLDRVIDATGSKSGGLDGVSTIGKADFLLGRIETLKGDTERFKRWYHDAVEEKQAILDGNKGPAECNDSKPDGVDWAVYDEDTGMWMDASFSLTSMAPPFLTTREVAKAIASVVYNRCTAKKVNWFFDKSEEGR